MSTTQDQTEGQAKKARSGRELSPKVRLELLRDLCGRLDPYAPLSEQDKELLAKLGVRSLDDPFAITNQLIVLMEDAIQDSIEEESTSEKAR